MLTAAAAALVLLAGCGGGDEDPAVEALHEQFGYLSDGQFGRLYDVIHPDQRETVDRELFIRCYDELGQIDVDLDVQETFEEEVTIAGTSEPTTATALTARVSGIIGGFPGEDTDTYHVYELDGAWYWALADDAYDSLAAGECFS